MRHVWILCPTGPIDPTFWNDRDGGREAGQAPPVAIESSCAWPTMESKDGSSLGMEEGHGWARRKRGGDRGTCATVQVERTLSLGLFSESKTTLSPGWREYLSTSNVFFKYFQLLEKHVKTKFVISKVSNSISL